jgi:hypothetical protein
VSGVSAEDLAESDLIRELEHLHRTRHDTFLHGAPDALREHTSRSAELEQEYLRRHPERDVDPARTRAGARGSEASFSPRRSGNGDGLRVLRTVSSDQRFADSRPRGDGLQPAQHDRPLWPSDSPICCSPTC